MPHIQRLLIGFCAGGLVLGLPWSGSTRLPMLLALGAALGLTIMVVLRAAARRGAPDGPCTVVLGMLIGLAWSGLAHDRALSARLDPDRRDGVVLVAAVTSRPEAAAGFGGEPGIRFVVRVRQGPRDLPGKRLRLAWYGNPPVAEGDLWRLQASVRGPWSFASPGGFDFERWLLGQGLDGTGWVRRGELVKAAADRWSRRVRGSAAEAIRHADLRHPGIARALLLGHGDAVGDRVWEDLRRTGTVHLLVISGLHVSLAASLGFMVAGAGARLWPPLLLRLDVRRAGCIGGAVLASAYLLLAEGDLPALRAGLMSAALLWLLAGGRRSSAGPLLLAALAVLLVLEPLAVHRQGFWLSFAAVAVLLLLLGPASGGRVRRLVQVQLGLSAGMLPLVASLTGTVPWLSMPANLVAVPVVGLVVVPGLLAGLALSPVWTGGADAAFGLADRGIAVVLWWVRLLAAADLPLVPAGSAALLLAQAGAIVMLVGPGRRYVPVVGLCLLLPCLRPDHEVPSGSFRVTALDVGQGSAVVVDTRRHRLLFDAGPAYPSGFDTGAAVVLPSLVSLGGGALDVLVLSHADSDHVGGVRAVRRALSPRRVWAGGDGSLAADGACHGRRWQWDGVAFELLEVERPRRASDNDRSCILLVNGGGVRMLIAGDIGVAVEARLMRVLASESPVHLLFAPHHGSLSSSGRAFVRVLRPQQVVVDAGRDNRFGHPHPEVLARYAEVGARVHRTGWDGALVWHSAWPERVVRWRRDRLPYWRAPWEPAPGGS